MCQTSLWRNTWDDPAVERPDFAVVCARLTRKDRKIKPVAITVNIPQDMHEPGLDATSLHAMEDVQYVDRFRHTYRSYVCAKSSS
jgi:hypothetical protein